MARFFNKKRKQNNQRKEFRNAKKRNFRNQHTAESFDAHPNSHDSIQVYAKIGRIVERVNFIELRINQIIADFYISPEKRNIFLEDFMFAGRLRLNDKVKILREILIRKGIRFDEVSFERWIHIRNMVAHGTPSHGIDRQAVLHFNGQIYDIDTEFRDFEKLQAKMERLMTQVCKNCSHNR